MSGLNNLRHMFEQESLVKDFVDVQLEQMINRDVRDMHLAIMEGKGEDIAADDAEAKSAQLLDKDDAEECKEGTCPDCGKDDDNCDCDDASDDEDEIMGDDDVEEMLADLDFETEAMHQQLENDGFYDAPKTGIAAMDPTTESEIDSIPEATMAEVAEFFRATETEGFEQNQALATESAVLDILIPDGPEIGDI